MNIEELHESLSNPPGTSLAKAAQLLMGADVDEHTLKCLKDEDLREMGMTVGMRSAIAKYLENPNLSSQASAAPVQSNQISAPPSLTQAQIEAAVRKQLLEEEKRREKADYKRRMKIYVETGVWEGGEPGKADQNIRDLILR